MQTQETACSRFKRSMLINLIRFQNNLRVTQMSAIRTLDDRYYMALSKVEVQLCFKLSSDCLCFYDIFVCSQLNNVVAN